MSQSGQQQDVDHLVRILTENFNLLADEVQILSDRKIILEHKLRFAHEQYQSLADKYAPVDADISSTLAALQLPPELQIQSPDRASFVPLPTRRAAGSKQQTAEAIRDGRKAVQRLSSLVVLNPSDTSGHSLSGSTNSNMRSSRRATSATTVLEQDFTVPGIKSKLLCPFAPKANNLPSVADGKEASSMATDAVAAHQVKDDTPHQSADPICAAMYAETHFSPPPSVAGLNKCPIRFLDQHSPEEVARYFETHKHEIPRSHEICVKRYQRNEEDIKKLDAKYGNLVSMLQGLGQKHQPMLPLEDDNEVEEPDRRSNERVENWAKAVSADENDVEDTEKAAPPPVEEVDAERQGRFDRPLKEVRLGESPSRPWGISVPYDVLPASASLDDEPVAPPVAVLVEKARPVGKCPFGHGSKAAVEVPSAVSAEPISAPAQAVSTGKCPFGHVSKPAEQSATTKEPNPEPIPQSMPEVTPPAAKIPPPTFLQQADLPKLAEKAGTGVQISFNGPVFIGYPMEQAMALMKEWQAGAAAQQQ